MGVYVRWVYMCLMGVYVFDGCICVSWVYMCFMGVYVFHGCICV